MTVERLCSGILSDPRMIPRFIKSIIQLEIAISGERRRKGPRVRLRSIVSLVESITQGVLWFLWAEFMRPGVTNCHYVELLKDITFSPRIQSNLGDVAIY